MTKVIEHGSKEHASLLGLAPVRGNAEVKWKLVDVTMYGPTTTQEFLDRVLEQKINELQTKPPKPQSKDPLAPNYAPEMWVPPRSQQ